MSARLYKFNLVTYGKSNYNRRIKKENLVVLILFSVVLGSVPGEYHDMMKYFMS